MVGTPAFMAPEVLASGSSTLSLASDLRYTCKSDCWSLGVVLYVLLSGSQPFSREFLGPSVQMKIMSGAFLPMTGDSWDLVTPQARDLVRQLLVVEPERRLSAAQILQHPWFAEDNATCSKARNKMFGTQDSVAGSTSDSQSVGETGDSGIGSKIGSREETGDSGIGSKIGSR